MTDPTAATSTGPDSAASPADDLATRTFEQLLAELEDLTGRMASGDIGIEAATDLYERASRIHAEATSRLDKVQSRIDGLAPGK